MRAKLFTNQFKNTISGIERRKIFIERMERKLAFKESLHRSHQHRLMRTWPTKSYLMPPR